ncbi:bifunctional adenosylcobinamide kinase/adenosylcobinamide-phosphate guanylyltransferase [Alkalicoccus urumqiensis]|nr:bifunctional adenosylcobinamide kinase/adenosylcobinamide-phosphate guanylyltransferase [Alkalicoccus urumqiensis]
MHVFIGGAFAGTLEAAQDRYPEAPVIRPGESFPPENGAVIIHDFRQYLHQNGEKAFHHLLDRLPAERIVLVMEEMGNGVVPLEKELRKLRDANGRAAARAVRKADDADYVWYGLSRPMKRRRREA